MHEFLKKIKAIKDSTDWHDLETNAYDQIVRQQMDNTSDDDVDDLDYTPQNKQIERGHFYPGNIYIFEYNASEKTKYKVGDTTIEFTDTYPMLLVTGATPTTIKGINLNLCNYALKTIILDLIYDFDERYFEGGFEEKSKNDTNVYSDNILKIFLDKDIDKKLAMYLQKVAPLKTYDLIFRNYSTSKIRNLRMVSPSQWKYIPFQTNTGNLKQKDLEGIYAITGIKNIRI